MQASRGSVEPDQDALYPLILRTRSYAWWRPVAGLLTLLVAAFLFVPYALLPVLAATVALDHQGRFSTALDAAAKLDPLTWQGLLYLNLTLATMTLVVWGLVRLLHGVHHLWLVSVARGFRWRFFWACFGLAVVAICAQLLMGVFLPGDPNDLGSGANPVDSRFVALALVVLLTTPFQAMGEEFVFRGYLMQLFGALTRRPWIAIVLSSVLFALAHGVQNAPLFLDRLVFGLMAGYVVLRTGGLEAGIALHIWNNLFAFGLALALGNIDDTLNADSIPWANISLTFTMNGVYLMLVLWTARRMGISNRTGTPVLAATTPHV